MSETRKKTLLYKLTDANGQTYNHTQWDEGVTHETSGEGELCGPGWIHAYTSPLLAVFLNPIHGRFKNPQLWECIGEGLEKSDYGLKVGRTRITTVKRIPLPVVTTNQRIAFSILAVLEVYKEPSFVLWTNNWLSGKDRTAADAEAVVRSAWSVAADAAVAGSVLDLQSLAEKALTYS
ncbi:Uncharacterised protein [uncultured archaeon]|nr:Uncharacterised protein [uncultured archaeon]